MNIGCDCVAVLCYAPCVCDCVCTSVLCRARSTSGTSVGVTAAATSAAGGAAISIQQPLSKTDAKELWEEEFQQKLHIVKINTLADIEQFQGTHMLGSTGVLLHRITAAILDDKVVTRLLTFACLHPFTIDALFSTDRSGGQGFTAL